MGNNRSQLPFQCLLLDFQAGQVFLEALSGDFKVMCCVGYRDHVFLSSSTLVLASSPG